LGIRVQERKRGKEMKAQEWKRSRMNKEDTE
jgi:hypothetical protein